MEGHYETREGAPLILFGIPDDEAQEMRYPLQIPKLGSFILTHHWDGEVKGLEAFPEDERPGAEVVFWSFRLMVALGVLMAAIGIWSAVARWRQNLFENRWLHRAAVLMTPSGFGAVIAGWVTTEVGRQPWTVHGLLKTADSASPIEAAAVGTSLIVFVMVYLAVFGTGTYYAVHLMSRAPGAGREEDVWLTRTAGIMPGPALRRERRIHTTGEGRHGD
jgi:cytochrome d ubiquinol oxidase subunit I